ALERTELLQLGSRVRYRTLLRLPESIAVAGTRRALAAALPDPAIRITAFDEAQPGLRRFFSQLTTHLRPVGPGSLLLGRIASSAAGSAWRRASGAASGASASRSRSSSAWASARAASP